MSGGRLYSITGRCFGHTDYKVQSFTVYKESIQSWPQRFTTKTTPIFRF